RPLRSRRGASAARAPHTRPRSRHRRRTDAALHPAACRPAGTAQSGRVRRLRHHSLGRPRSASRRQIRRHMGAAGARAGDCSNRRVGSARWIRRLGRRPQNARPQRCTDHLVWTACGRLSPTLRLRPCSGGRRPRRRASLAGLSRKADFRGPQCGVRLKAIDCRMPAARSWRMIDVHYWTTPNGHKITMLLEETGLPYRIVPVNIGKGDQFRPEFLRISPNNRIPGIVDHEPAGGGPPVSVFESGAILLYLARKTGKLIPSDLRGEVETLQWLFWQVAGLGPMAGQNHHFTQYAPEKIPYAVERYVKETNRLYGVLNHRLADRAYVAGAAY